MKIKAKCKAWTLLDTSIPVLWLQDETVTLPALSLVLLLRGAPRPFHFVGFTGNHWEDNNNSAKTKQKYSEELSFETSKHCWVCWQFVNPSDTIHKSLFYFSWLWLKNGFRCGCSCGLTNFSSKDSVSLSLSHPQGETMWARVLSCRWSS